MSEEQGGGSGCSTSTFSDPGAQKRPSWVEYYMNMAFCVSMRSKDPVLQVGCIIVDRKTLRVLSVGYNGFPPGIENEDQNWQKGKKSDLVVHAEANAVLLAGQADLKGSIAFVTTFPCLECAKMLKATGVRKVYYLSLKDKYHKQSIDFIKAAEVEIVPLRRGEGTTLEEFKVDLIDRLENVIAQMQFEPIYQDLQKIKEHVKRVKDTALEKFKVDLIYRLRNVMAQMQFEAIYQDLQKITEQVWRVEDTKLETFKVDLIDRLENVIARMQFEAIYQDLRKITEDIWQVEDTTLEDLSNKLENAMEQMQKQQLPGKANGTCRNLREITEHITSVENTTLEEFKDCLLKKLENVLKQMQKQQLPVEANGTYQDLWKITEHRRRKDLKSPWPREFKIDEILMDSWPDYFLFLALMASTRALENPQGVTLIDSTTFKVSALAYNGCPRGVKSDMQNYSMQVSALINAICLRSSEGHDFYAFATHFPSLQDAKNLAQAKIKRLYFIWPKSLEGDNKRALEILQKAGMKVVPMNVPNLAQLERAIEKTTEHLQNVEEKEQRPFSDWPNHFWTDYELQPEQVSQSGNAQ